MAHLATRQGVGPDHRRRAIGPAQINLGFAVAEDMDMRRPVIVDVNDDTKTIDMEHGNQVG